MANRSETIDEYTGEAVGLVNYGEEVWRFMAKGKRQALQQKKYMDYEVFAAALNKEWMLYAETAAERIADQVQITLKQTRDPRKQPKVLNEMTMPKATMSSTMVENMMHYRI